VQDLSRNHWSSAGVKMLVNASFSSDLYFSEEHLCVSGCKDEQDLLASPLDMMKKFKKKKRVRAHTQPPVFSGLAFTSPAKTVIKFINTTVRVSNCNY
jgi:hypothetical protein